MAAAVLKMYFIGTALSVFAVIYAIVDSFGGLMYVQDQNYTLELYQQTHRELSPTNHRRGSCVEKESARGWNIST